MLKKFLPHIILALLSGLTLLSGCVIFGANRPDPAAVSQAPEKLYSPEELAEDFSRLRKILETKTVGLYTDREELSRRLDTAEEELTRPMTELEFYRLLTPSVAALRCGHSFLSVSETMEAHMHRHSLFFPLPVRFSGSRIFVIDDPRHTGVVPGSEIISINGKPSGEIIRTITGMLSTDGDDTGRPRYDAERWFAALYYSFIDTAELFEMEIVAPGATDSTRTSLAGVRDSSLAQTAQGVVYHTLNAPYSRSFHSDYALLSIPCFGYSDFGAYKRFLNDFFTNLKLRGTETLVIDLRGNYGGSPKPTVELFQYLIDTPLPFFGRENIFYLAPWKRPIKPAEHNFQGELYVLMDEAGFSMNSFLLSLLKYHRIGTLAGAPSAGGWMCSDAARGAVLPHTGLRLKYSTRVFSTAVEGMKPGRGIEPDLPVFWTLEDYLEGGDPVLEAALREALK